MSKDRFGEILDTLQAQHLPSGNVELVEEDEFNDHPFLSGLPFLKSISELQLESEDKYYVITKITDKLFLSISEVKASSNIGILKNISKRISNEIRTAAIKPI
ncbi:hypothetical protein [Marinoscillum sp. MHG1-6]|uniref:hypothetical protein n=1 Tax=Marinoscillum sp. MHG1-6 TaxID=2959627 RepID=UPI002157CB21|nr:hypothetical protein [Marinoscillum sp. MHG1-6]